MSLGQTASAPDSAWLTAVRAKSSLDDAVVVVGARGLLVLLLWNAEEEQSRDAELDTLSGLADDLVDRELGDVGEPFERLRDSFAGADEERHHEVVEMQSRLPDELAQGARAPQPAEPRGGEGAHGGKPTSLGKETAGRSPCQHAESEPEPKQPERFPPDLGPGAHVEQRRPEQLDCVGERKRLADPGRRRDGFLRDEAEEDDR